MQTFTASIRLTENTNAVRAPFIRCGEMQIVAAKPGEAAKIARDQIAAVCDPAVIGHVCVTVRGINGSRQTFKSERRI